jgi:hypothetical protein
MVVVLEYEHLSGNLTNTYMSNTHGFAMLREQL